MSSRSTSRSTPVSSCSTELKALLGRIGRSGIACASAANCKNVRTAVIQRKMSGGSSEPFHDLAQGSLRGNLKPKAAADPELGTRHEGRRAVVRCTWARLSQILKSGHEQAKRPQFPWPASCAKAGCAENACQRDVRIGFSFWHPARHSNQGLPISRARFW